MLRRPVYSDYLATTHLFNMSPLQDQEGAGALIWVRVTLRIWSPRLSSQCKFCCTRAYPRWKCGSGGNSLRVAEQF